MSIPAAKRPLETMRRSWQPLDWLELLAAIAVAPAIGYMVAHFIALLTGSG